MIGFGDLLGWIWKRYRLEWHREVSASGTGTYIVSQGSDVVVWSADGSDLWFAGEEAEVGVWNSDAASNETILYCERE